MKRCQFASDNTAGLCPEVFRALAEANNGFVPAYGEDKITLEAANGFRTIFGVDCDVYFVFNGTAANCLALASLCQSYHSVIAHEAAHIETDECGGPEFFSNGTKLLLAEGDGGKISPDAVERLVVKRSDVHYPRPRVLSLTQPTELGTVYTKEELRELCALARRHNLKVHMDGARFAHAVAYLGASPRELTADVGVDVLTLGGTKLGGLSESVVYFDRQLSVEFAYRCKQAGQLASKMRFLAAPWTAMFTENCWLEYARHANRCAQQLRREIENIPGLELLYPTEANSVFLRLPQSAISWLKEKGWVFYVFIGGGARFMCSWATTHDDIDALARDIRQALC